MARWLPMFPKLPVLAVEETPSLSTNPDCKLCDYHKPIGGKPIKSVCMKPAGSPGGVLFVAESPTGADDVRGRPMSGEGGRLVRHLAMKMWDGPIAYDNAVKCKVGKRKLTDAKVRKCRGYLAKTIRTARPQRIITLGKWAAYSVLGRAVSINDIPNAWSWYTNPLIPVFMLRDPVDATQNDFIRDQFEEALKWALQCDLGPLKEQCPWEGVVYLVDDEESAKEAYAELTNPGSEFVVYDAETAGLVMEHGIKGDPIHVPWEILCQGLSASNSEDVWVWTEKGLKDKKARAILKRIMEDPKIPLAATNEKFDRKTMQWLDIHPTNVMFDARLMRKIQDPTASARLETMQEMVGMGGGKDEMQAELERVTKIARKMPTAKQREKAEKDPDFLLPGSKEWQIKEGGPQFEKKWHLAQALRAAKGTKLKKEFVAYGLVDPDLTHRYNGIDVHSTKAVVKLLDRQWKYTPSCLQGVWEDLVRPANNAVAQVESWGIYANQRGIEAYRSWARRETEQAIARIRKLAPDLDPNSNDQLAAFLFDRLKLPTLKKTESGKRSTDKGVLEALKKEHPIVEDLITYRQVTKQGGTYAETFAMHVRADGRIHPSLLIDGTETGRLSCTGPNLQNIPRSGSIAGRLARDCFGVPPGHVLLQFDYSQLELRVAAMESRDTAMTEIFKSGVDFHLQTAKMISEVAWGISEDSVTKEHRSLAKAVNFGAAYGKSAGTFAKEWGVPIEKAQTIVDAIMGGFPNFAKYMKTCLSEARRTGYCWTTSPLDGKRFRRRPLFKVRDADSKARSRAEHGSWNTPIQGKASDFCLFSLVEIVKWIQEEGLPVKLVLTVHDSIMLEVPYEYVNEVIFVVRQIMTQWESFGVPIVVDVEAGLTWGSLLPVVEEGGNFCLKKTVKDNSGEESTILVPWEKELIAA